jgi:hypothetical protein
MHPSQMVSDMCHNVLGQADIKAICRARGFSAQEAASRAVFVNFLLSDIGVAEALQKLSQTEISLLYLLKSGGQAVDVSFFQPLYDPQHGPNWRYLTFTQRYQKTLQQVKQALVRRGVLLMAEDLKAANAQTKMERWRFRFPQEFEKFLPSPFTQTRTFANPGQFNESLVRGKLLEIMGEFSTAARLKGEQYRLHLTNGQLYLGDRRFQLKYLQEWQQAEWAFVIQAGKIMTAGTNPHFKSPLEAVTYALSLLKPQEWLAPQELAVLLKVFCPPAGPQADRICQAGWQWGCLVKQVDAGQSYYRLPDADLLAGAGLEPNRYLQLDSAQTLGLNLQLIPYQSLEYLARLADLQVINRQLTASPNLVKMGRAMPSLQTHPLTVWLQENVPAFAGALKTLHQRWGKKIVHQDLLIAKIKDLSLKVTLQKAITDPGQVIFLPHDFIAFPRSQAGAIEKLVNKAGHVIKWVQAE